MRATKKLSVTDMNKHTQFLIGAASIIAAFFLMSLFGVFNKFIVANEDLVLASFWTFVTAFILLLPLIAYRGFDTVKTNRLTLHLLRAVIGVSASYFYFAALTRVPLANATLLYSTTPFFIPVIVYFSYGSRISLINWLAILIGFVGIAFILRPNVGAFDQMGNVYGLMGGFCLASVFVIVKELTKTEDITTIIFYFSGLGALIQLPFAIAYWNPIHLTSTYWIILVIALTFFCSQYLVAYAYTFAPPAKLGVFQYLMIVFVGIFDWIIWNQVPTPLDWVGAAIVIAAGIVAIREGERKR